MNLLDWKAPGQSAGWTNACRAYLWSQEEGVFLHHGGWLAFFSIFQQHSVWMSQGIFPLHMLFILEVPHILLLILHGDKLCVGKFIDIKICQGWYKGFSGPTATLGWLRREAFLHILHFQMTKFSPQIFYERTWKCECDKCICKHVFHTATLTGELKLAVECRLYGKPGFALHVWNP